MEEIKNKMLKSVIADADRLLAHSTAAAKLTLEEEFAPAFKKMIARNLRIEAESVTQPEELEELNSSGIGTGDNKKSAEFDSSKIGSATDPDAPESTDVSATADQKLDSSSIGTGDNKKAAEFDSSSIGTKKDSGMPHITEELVTEDDSEYNEDMELDLESIIAELERDLEDDKDDDSDEETDDDTEEGEHADSEEDSEESEEDSDNPEHSKEESPFAKKDDSDGSEKEDSKDEPEMGATESPFAKKDEAPMMGKPEEAPTGDVPADDKRIDDPTANLDMKAPGHDDSGMEGQDEFEHGNKTLDLEAILREMEVEELAADEYFHKISSERESLKAELAQYREAVGILQGKLQEVNLLNAKLLYTNQLFRKDGLDTDQKLNIVETFDRAKNVREVKLIYVALTEHLSVKPKTAKLEHKKKMVTEGLASAATGTAPEKKTPEVIEENKVFNRLQYLAGIKKQLS